MRSKVRIQFSSVVRRQVVACIAIFVVLFLGSFQIGPITFRNAVAVLLGVSICINISFFKSNKYFNNFVAFVLAILFCTLASGDLFTEQFLRFFIGYHVTSIIVYIALFAILSRIKSINPIIVFISSIFIFNAILTIAQSFNHNSAWQLVSLIYNKTNVSEFQEDLSNTETIRNVFVCGGLCGSVVGNGYFTSVFYPLATLNIWKNDKIGKVYSFCVMAITLYSSFCLQQRMCFYLVVLYSLYMIVFSVKGRSRIITLFFFALALIFIGDINPEANDLGHISQNISSDYERQALFQQFDQFLHTGNIFIGGQLEYLNYGGGQHNTFLDCMTRYGIIGTVILLILYFRVLSYCIKLFFEFRRLGMYELMSLSVCPIIYLLYSLTHSTGLQSGDPLFWIAFALLYSGECKYRQNLQSNEELIITK